jgi:hypothetical protein
LSGGRTSWFSRRRFLLRPPADVNAAPHPAIRFASPHSIVLLGNWLTADLAPIRAEADPRLRWSSLQIAEPEGTRYVAMRGWRKGLDGAKTAAVDMG